MRGQNKASTQSAPSQISASRPPKSHEKSEPADGFNHALKERNRTSKALSDLIPDASLSGMLSSELMGVPKRRLFIALACTLAITLCCFVAIDAGRFLVIDNPRHADFILVLSGDIDDVRAVHGLMLLREGYAQQLILDAPDSPLYGRNQAELAQEYLQRAAPDHVGRVHVCKFSSDSTRQELAEVSGCIHSLIPDARSGLLVTSTYHTRRAVEVARRVQPQYHWSIAAAVDPQFDVHWWRSREQAKTTITEWQKLLWWTLVEQWATNSPSRIRR